MPRYVVERTFATGLGIPAGAEGAESCRAVVERNEHYGVTWGGWNDLLAKWQAYRAAASELRVYALPDLLRSAQ